MRDDAAQPHEPDPPTGAALEEERALAARLSDSPAVSSEESGAARPEAGDTPPGASEAGPETEAEPAADGGDTAAAPQAEDDTPARPADREVDAPPPEEGGGTLSASPDETDAPSREIDVDIDALLLEDGGDALSVSSDEDEAPASPAEGAAAAATAPDEGDAGADGAPWFADAAAEEAEEVAAGPAAALAFATDADTEEALRDGLFHYEGPSPDCGEAQVWPGGLRAAIAALADGHSTRLVFVDIDGILYPAGAIHELAAVCEVGTVVIAIGSDDSAQPGRELLLAGVSDYLAKPLTAEAVRAAAARAATAGAPASGRVAGLAGPGGSGKTTLTAALALHAAARGCYVSVLDLDRSVAALALSLDVEPAAGLDQLLEAAAQSAPDPEMIAGVRTRRSDRIEVYAHRWDPSLPAAPQAASVEQVLAALRRRSQLVLVDGFAEAAVDTRILVVEPIAGRAADAARMLDLPEHDRPPLLVQNHTRAFKRRAGAQALRDAGIERAPDIAVPFDASVPEAADRGWPDDRLPRSLRAPMTALADRLLASATP